MHLSETTRVLLVEDDAMLTRIIRYYLENEEAYDISCAKTAGEALGLARKRFDVILMDVLLPDGDGVELCQRLRQWHDCPVIFISCLDDSDTIVRALAGGGDDYIPKPFDNKVLAAHIQANLRRYQAPQAAPSRQKGLSRGDFSLNADKHIVTHAGRRIQLSNIEYRLLFFLMTNEGQCYLPSELYENVWGCPCVGDTRTVLVHIHNLRQKIEEEPAHPRYLKLVWGEGYCFDSAGKAGTGKEEGA